MKKFILLVLVFSTFVGFSQSRQEDTATTYQAIIPSSKVGLLKNVDMIMNMQYGLRNDFVEGAYIDSRFRFEQIRFEIKGYVHERVFFRFRHRYTSTFEPQTIDKIIKGVDFAYVRIDLDKSKKWQLTLGKTFADWGGVEFDLNPIDIYEYSDIIEMADNFLTGAGIYYQANKNHGFSFQVLDSRTASFEEIYDTVLNVTPLSVPLATVFNWRGSFFDGFWKTMFSYSLFAEAEGKFKNYIALGNQFDFGKVQVAYDYKLSMEDLDRTQIISNEFIDDSLVVPGVPNTTFQNTAYQSHWLKIDYRFAPKWGVSFVGFIDQAFWRSENNPLETELIRTGYGYIPTLEFFPWDNLNLKFYAGYVGRSFVYEEEPAPYLNQTNNYSRIIIGFISPLTIL